MLPPDEVERRDDRIGGRRGERVRAGDVVDARVARVLRDRAGPEIGRRVAPVDRRGEAARGERGDRSSPRRESREDRRHMAAVKLPTGILT